MRDIAIPLPLARTILSPIFRLTLNDRLPWRLQRLLMDAGSRLQPAPAGTDLRRVQLAGRPAERFTAGTPGEGAVLYLHGGGYAVGSPTTHRSLTARLAHETGCAVYSLDYRLAPEHPFPAGLDDAEAAFLELVDEHGYAPEQIAISGDSAGGGLALATAQRLIGRHGHTPAALGLIAPWTDPNQIPDRYRDLVISKPWSRACAAAYLGAGDSNDPGYAPLLGELRGLPPTYVQVDVSELLHPQCVDLTAALRDVGVAVTFTETRGLWHVAQLQAALVGPAAAVLTGMAEFLSEAIRPAHIRDLG
ncbi:alpha/beta hydrolase [Nocardia cyriacigeorgica]|uniref:Alpha/beta hydrolase n=1 Tax=Nocardia cyriacigeorgica TaxID=135487 RepID=A0A6P1D5P1_9NOCA|nr:alpha/beta hydrolase [Nocardia cyriacigeorgica]NEW43502.1 alpha/beta hydrolase [Nocardia cyriacigeorgica]